MKKLAEVNEILAQQGGYSWYSKLQLSEEKSYLREMQEELETYVPKVAVMGEFSAGKSTLINSFLGKELLPAKYEPTTKFNTEIKYSKENYILMDGERIEATKENLETIDTIDSDKIEIFLNNPILENLSFVDTPGTNDPSGFSDDIVFSLIGEVDIVLFVMSAYHALTNTEKQFISKLIREKDIGKFFFVINWADKIENPRVLKKETVDNLASLLGLNKNILMSHTFLYSAKEALSRRLKGEEDGKYDVLSESIETFIAENRTAIVEQWVEHEVGTIVDSIELKIEALEDKITGHSEKYEEELTLIDKEVKVFELEISKETIQFKRDFNQIKSNYKQSTKDTVKYILDEIKNDIDSMNYEDLVGSRFVELRTKKLLEDKIEENTKIFLENMGKLLSDFDAKVVTSTNIDSINMPRLTKAGKSKKVVNVAAVAATAMGAAAAAPAVSGIVATGGILAGVGAIAPTLALIPVVGPLLAGAAGIGALAIPIVGTFAIATGKVLFDVGKWGVGKVGDVAIYAEEKAKKMAYVNQVKKSLDTIEEQIISDIDKIGVESFEEQYVDSKFPQKSMLEKKIELVKSKQMDTDTHAQEEISELESFKNKLGVL